MKKTLSLLLLVVLAWQPLVFGQLPGELTSKVRSLLGVDGFRVVVGEFRQDVKNAGLNEEEFKDAVELRLRSLGVRVDDRLFPYLYVYVNLGTIKDHDQSVQKFVVKARIDFMREVLIPSSEVYVFASTWSDFTVGTVGKNNVDQVKGAVIDQVDNFANDYLKANPPEPRSGQGDE